MGASVNFFASILVLLCVFSVIVRDFSSGPTLFWAIIASLSVIFAVVILKSEIFLLLLAFFVLIVRPVTIFAHRFRAKKKFRASLRPCVRALVLNVKLGMSLREGIRRQISQECGDSTVQIQLEKVLLMLTRQHFLPSSDRRWDDFAKLMLSLDRNPVRVTPQLEAFRHQLRIEEKFAARVAQILVQPRLQAGVILLLYIGLIFFVVSNFPATEFQFFMFVSVFAVGAGLLRLFFLGRTYRWKV